MKRLVATGLCLCLLATVPVDAGVVMQLVSKDPTGNVTNRMNFFVLDGMVRMDESDGNMSMLFLGNGMTVLDHKERSYLVMDDAMIEQLQAAMQKMQAQLAAMPPEQRAMVEQMMQGKMPGGGETPPPPRIESLGSGEWGDYACDRYAVYAGGQKIEEICAAALGKVTGGDEVMAAFRGMAAYLRKIIESMPAPMASMMGNNPIGYMEQIKGFPVQNISFQSGQVSDETTLESVREENVDTGMFSPPDDYRRQDPGLR